jgi:trimethylamine--corrinoid protein Co-methyltransferase
MIPQFAQFLSQTEVLRIHEASLEILEEAGLLVRNSRARERMAKRGCLVDEDTGI